MYWGIGNPAPDFNGDVRKGDNLYTECMHGDHTQGLPAYRRIAPGVNIISSSKPRDLMVQLSPTRLKTAVDNVPQSIENLSVRLSSAKTPEEKAWCTEMIAQSKASDAGLEEIGVSPWNSYVAPWGVRRLSYRGKTVSKLSALELLGLALSEKADSPNC